MATFKIAMNMLFRHFENDAQQMAKLMECDRITDYRYAQVLLVEMLIDVGKVIVALDEERRAQELPARPFPLQESKPVPITPTKSKRSRKRKIFSSEDLRESKRLAAARRHLRDRGYEIARGSKVAYWDKWTERRLDWENSGKYGFTYERK